MKINSFNECDCGVLIETNELWCDDCHARDIISAAGTDTFLDQLFLEEQLNEYGELDIEDVEIYF